MQSGLVSEHAGTAPRYTSYPTSPHFHAGIGSETYREWLSNLSPGTGLSLYVHIPYCSSLCWFCGCHTRATRHYEPVARYLRVLQEEIALVSAALPKGCTVRQIHWGGGSPTILSGEDTAALAATIRGAFEIADDFEFSAEIDPRKLSRAQITALLDAGLTRASFGIQDFNPEVQEAINRDQSFALTKAVVDVFRLGGVASINADVLYGLPHQTTSFLLSTLVKVLALQPDRIALFGYAHVPWLKRNMTLIDSTALPDADERRRASQIAAELIAAWGYERIGLDHFALPDDRLAQASRGGRLRRNFQGYTDDDCEVLIGLGASSVSHLPEGYVQNAIPAEEYARQVNSGQLPVTRGVALSADDRVRAFAIERLMCDFRLNGGDVRRRFGADAEGVLAEADALFAKDAAGLLARDGETLRVTERGRPYVRSICARLDPYFAGGTARHSMAV